jgi:ribonucleoside-diphosphate reductase beta chain
MPQQFTSASIHELGKLPVDKIIIGEIDDTLTHLPTYQDLYHRWEKQQWSALDIDFRVDRVHWAEMPLESRPFLMSGFVLFFQGEVSVTNALLPYCAAMPTEEQRLFLITQLADETRHAMFFNRFFKEVLLMEGPDMESLLMQIRSLLDPAPREILVQGLMEISQKIHDEPKNLAYLVEGVTLYHIIVEATLALAGQRNMLNRHRRSGLYPGFQQGFMAAARDESRHVLFGVKFLREIVARHPRYAEVIHTTIIRWMPQIHATLHLTEFQRSLMVSIGSDPDDMITFGMNSLRKKLKVIGVMVDLPLSV